MFLRLIRVVSVYSKISSMMIVEGVNSFWGLVQCLFGCVLSGQCVWIYVGVVFSDVVRRCLVGQGCIPGMGWGWGWGVTRTLT